MQDYPKKKFQFHCRHYYYYCPTDPLSNNATEVSKIAYLKFINAVISLKDQYSKTKPVQQNIEMAAIYQSISHRF